MNGKDGKPFKTRDGGVMKLESLLDEIKEETSKYVKDNDAMSQCKGCKGQVYAEDGKKISRLRL